MGHIYEEFERELSQAAEEYRDHPELEFMHLFLMALEREQIVSVAYRESLIADRLDRMPIDPETRSMIRHALMWAWKDEEMHAIYIRGAILRLGRIRLRLQAFVTQAAGALGGWAASVNQHARWRDAPFSRLAARILAWGGSVSGKIPRNVRKHLEYGPFRNFCLFNVDAEKTAWLCWHRIAELANRLPGTTEEMRADFLRIERDELQHERVFQILAEALDEEDRLLPTETAGSLAEKIGAIGEFFLPRSHRVSFSRENPIGSGGRVHVCLAQSRDQKIGSFQQFLNECGIAEALAERAQQKQKPVSQFRIAIKPTFMLGYDRKDPSTITDPALVNALARYLKEQGCEDVAVLESPNLYDKFYGNRSVREVASYFSYSSPDYRLVDMSEEQTPHAYVRGLAQYRVSATWKDADFRISFGKMRSHPVELALLTVGNLEGIGNRCEEFLFVERQAHRETAVMTLISDFPSHFAILDAFENVPDGLVGVIACPRPKQVLRFYGGRDALAVDAVAGRHLGMNHPHQSSILEAATHWFGSSNPVSVTGTDLRVANWRSPYHNEFSTLLSILALPVYVWGSGRGSLFVPEMDPEAFPLLVPESSFLSLARRFLQSFLGIRHPKPRPV